MATSIDWVLPAKIIELSQADNWASAVREWSLAHIEILDPGEFSECLCGHKPIRELCYIFNRKTKQTAIVGNHCIEKFDKDDPGREVFGSTIRTFQAAKRIFGDATASANEDLIALALSRKVFTEKDADFYRDIWRKRNLSDKQEDYKYSLNQRLLYQVILSTRVAYQRLKRDPEEGTAGPKLIKYAFEKEVLKEKDYAFYMQVWQQDVAKLTPAQAKYRTGLNNRIIRELSTELDQ